MPTFADELRAIADALADFPELREADRLDAIADRHAAEHMAPGWPIEPEICTRLRGWAFQLRQLRAPERDVRDALRDEAKRLERPS